MPVYRVQSETKVGLDCVHGSTKGVLQRALVAHTTHSTYTHYCRSEFTVNMYDDKLSVVAVV